MLTHISFEAGPAGRPLLAACDWLRAQQDRKKPDNNAPREVIDKAWQPYVAQKDGRVDIRAFTFCVLSHLQTAIHRRDVFTRPSWRYADPRANLLSDAEWEATRPIVCRTLGLPPDPQPILDSLAVELDKTYREVARRLPDNPDVRFEKVKGKEELILTPLDALDEPPSLNWLQGRGGATTARGVGGAGTGGGRADRLHGSVYASDRSFCANCGFCLESVRRRCQRHEILPADIADKILRSAGRPKLEDLISFRL